MRPPTPRICEDRSPRAGEGGGGGGKKSRGREPGRPFGGGVLRRLKEKQRRPGGARRPPLRAEAGQTGSAVRSHQVCPGRRWNRCRRRRSLKMKMELIQPFINAADAVLAQGLQSPTSIGNLSMDEEVYRRKGVAALISVTGDIEGRIIFDLDPDTAVRVASRFAASELPESDELVRETGC